MKRRIIVGGKVTSVDPAAFTLTVTDEAGKSYVLIATKEETSIWKGDNTIELTESENRRTDRIRILQEQRRQARRDMDRRPDKKRRPRRQKLSPQHQHRHQR